MQNWFVPLKQMLLDFIFIILAASHYDIIAKAIIGLAAICICFEIINLIIVKLPKAD